MSDLISRQAAIEAVSDFGICIQRIVDLPSAPRWIPVSERLPEARLSVILSTKDWSGEGCYWETTVHHVIWKGYRWNATYWDDEVIAWMPLPEAWRGEEDGERKQIHDQS